MRLQLASGALCSLFRTIARLTFSSASAQALAAWQRDIAAAYAAPRSAGARLGRLALAYPEFGPLLPAVEAGWAGGTTRAHLIPLDAVNGTGGAPQVTQHDTRWISSIECARNAKRRPLAPQLPRRRLQCWPCRMCWAEVVVHQTGPA